MALESLKQKLSSLPGSQAPASNARATPVPRISFSSPAPSFKTANSTPQFAPPEAGTFNTIKSGLKLLNPLSTQITTRPLFALADEKLPIRGGIIGGLGYEVFARTIEAIPGIALTTIANFRKLGDSLGGGTGEGRVNLPFDASRLGFTDQVGQRYVQDSGAKMAARFDIYEKAHPDRRGVNLALAALSPVTDALDAFALEGILTTVAKQGLKYTKYSPELNKALQQYGIQDLKGQELTDKFVANFNKKARKLILNEDTEGLEELGRATNVILTNMTGKGIPTLNRFGKMIQDVSRLGLQDAKKGFSLKNPMFAEIAPDVPVRGLPGTVVEPGQAPALGLSIRRVRRVGGAEDQPAGGPYFRSAEGGKRFDPIEEKNVMSVPIKKDLDTFVAKSDEGFSVIEGKTGQQLGETEKTMALAITSAKRAIEALPEQELTKMLDEAPLSPRYEQVDNSPQLSLDLPKPQPKPKMTPDTPENAAAEYYDAKIRPEVSGGKAFVVGADDMKEYFGGDYDDKNHATYSKAAFQLFEKGLKENGEDLVVFTGAGPGSGKTEILVKTLIGPGKFNGVVYDSNFSNKEGAMKQIQMAREAGKRVEVYGIIPDLGSTRVHTILRENETGRGISDKTFARGHAGFPKVVRELLEEGFLKTDEVLLLDTRGVTTIKQAVDKVMNQDFSTKPLALLQKLGYNEEEIIKKYAKERYKKDPNTITPKRVSNARSGQNDRISPAQNRPNKGEADRPGDRKGLEGRAEKPARVNKKLEERVKEARSFDDFYNRSGVTMGSLDATARNKGYAGAREFYDAQKALAQPAPNPLPNEDQSLQLLAEQANQSSFFLQPSERETIRIEDNLKQIFASLKGVDTGDLKTDFTEETLDRARMQYEFMSDGLVDHPGRALVKFISKKEGQFLDPKNPNSAKTPREREAIIERNKKIMRASESAFEGTNKSDMYDDPDTIREAIEDYQEKRDALIQIQKKVSEIHRSIMLAKQAGKFIEKNKKQLADKTLKQTTALTNLVRAAELSGFRKGLQQGSKKYETLIGNLRERRKKIAGLQEAYDMSDAEFAKMRGQKDPRFLTKQEFDQYLAGIEIAAAKFVQRRTERVIINALISENGLKKTDNLRRALEFPKIENMKLDQLVKFGDILAKTAPGDTFLGPRMIQTAKNTELGDIKTMSEGRAAVAKKLGIDPKDVTETADADVFLDAFLRDPAWAERDPLRKMIVLDWAAGDVQRLNKEKILRQEIEKLAQASRKSRRKAGGILGTFREKLFSRFAKTDDNVAKYMETLPKDLGYLEKMMTPEEINFGKFGRELMQKYYQYATDDAAQRWTLAGVRNSRFKDMYLPHMGPKFFERWRDNGFVGAVKTLFNSVQDTKVDFDAFGDKGEVLGYEKFFKNAQKRENLEASEYSKNVAAVLLRYVGAFEKKILLDSQIPKIKLLEQLLGRKYRTPKTITNPEGVEKVSSSLTRVLNEWINNKKGQKIETLRIKQGSQVEKFLQSTNILISLMDLGGNIITQTASGGGGELFNVLAYARGNGGVKGWLKGHKRALTKQGRTIARENPGVIDEAPWNTLADSFNEAGQTLMSSMFYIFGDLAYRARRQLFLGLLTKDEFQSGIISSRRLAEIKLKIGEVHALPEFRSVQGGTALMQLANKYSEWAIPNFQTSARIVSQVLKDAKKAKSTGGKAGLKEFMKTRAYKDAAITAIVGIGAYVVGQIVFEPEEDKQSPIGKWRAKVAREMGSVIQSATGVGVFGSSRAMDLLQQLQNLAKLAITLERYEKSGKGYKAGDLKFPNAAQRLVTPAFVRQFTSSGGSGGKPIAIPQGSKSPASGALNRLNRLKPNNGNVAPGLNNLNRLKKQLGN